MKLLSVTYKDKINEIVEAERDGMVSPQAAVLAMGLEQTAPAEVAGPSSANESSLNIARLFAPICSLDVNEVAEVMLALGYKIWLDPFDGPVWCLKPSEPYSPEDDGGD